MSAVLKKSKQKGVKKVDAVKKQKKFVSESLASKKSKKDTKVGKKHRLRKRGIVYIKHLPHGFYEEQLRGYFSQFGAITRLRLARSPKTLGSKGYAFIEFRYPEVAQIAAEAMNNYIMFKNIIKTIFIQPKDIKHDYFRSSIMKIKQNGEKVLTSKMIQARDVVVANTNKLMTTEDEQKRIKKIGLKLNKTKAKLAQLGIDYDVDAIAENMGEEVMKAAEKSKGMTIDQLPDTDDEADDTFDPATLDIDSDDEFDDFEYDSEHSDEEEDGIEVNIDDEKIQLDNAIRIAKDVSKRNLETNKKLEAPTKKEKRAVQVSSNPAEKRTRPVKKKPESVEAEAPVVPAKIKRNAAKKLPAPVVTEKAKPAMKKAKKEAPGVPEISDGGKKKKPQKTPEIEVTNKTQKKLKLAKESPSEVTLPKSDVKKKENIAPSTPIKTKKLAKSSTGIDKKKLKEKPVKADKKLKLAAKLVTQEISAETVKVIKSKDIRGKKKGANKK